VAEVVKLQVGLLAMAVPAMFLAPVVTVAV
jgi:hypothetical protein